MKTVGLTLKDSRVKKHYSREKIEEVTKIKKGFIRSIESNSWDELPEYPVVVGFVKSYARAVGLNVAQTVAILRRDYPPRALSVNPKPDVSAKFVWSPKHTFFVSLSMVSFLVVGYLAFQYIKFVRPPELSVLQPGENEVVRTTKLRVEGKTDPDATVKINNQLALVDEDGNFSSEIEIFGGTNEVEVKAISRSGKETVIKRKITPSLE